MVVEKLSKKDKYNTNCRNDKDLFVFIFLIHFFGLLKLLLFRNSMTANGSSIGDGRASQCYFCLVPNVGCCLTREEDKIPSSIVNVLTGSKPHTKNCRASSERPALLLPISC